MGGLCGMCLFTDLVFIAALSETRKVLYISSVCTCDTNYEEK